MKLRFCLLILFILVALAASSSADEKKPAKAPASPMAEGRFGKALDARVAAAVVAGHADFRMPPLTVECWVKLEQKREYNIIVANETKASPTHWELFTEAGTGKLSVYMPGMHPDHVRSEADPCDGKWRHLAMVYLPGRVRLYVDGKQVADQPVRSLGGKSREENFSIGALVEGQLRCQGLIDEVHIVRREVDVHALPDKAPQAEKETLALWRFDAPPEKDKGFADASPKARYAMVSSRGTAGQPIVHVPPVCRDQRLTIELFAEHPDVVTPVGIVVDRRGRLLVLESNTHFPPKDYKRHKTDRILWLQDTGGDGKADKVTAIADGFTHAMHMTVHPDGSLYVVTRGSVVRLRERGGKALPGDNGLKDKNLERQTLVRLDTKGTYPHNGLFSCAFDWRNQMYISMGENLGEDYKLIGSDNSVVAGGGEGGNVFRATAEGGKVEKIATGFWNPVQLHFDVFGRLFTVDNDPDSRPPCRLIHVVPGGDYGYRFRNGRPGLHPFTAWNGELPGTLPMVAGTGEAPSGLLTCEYDSLPDDYRGKMLVTSWGDHRIDVFTLTRRGASFRATSLPLVTGGEDFRPVGMVAASDGCIYFTDWVDKSYELHLKGRVWRIRKKEHKPAVRPNSDDPTRELTSKDRDVREAAARRLAASEEGRALLREKAEKAADVRVRATAWGALSAAAKRHEELWDAAMRDSKADVRELAALLLPGRDKQKCATAAADASDAVRAGILSTIELSPVTLPTSMGVRLLGDALGSDDPFLRTAGRDSLRRAEGQTPIPILYTFGPERRRVELLLARRAQNIPNDLPDFGDLLRSPDDALRFVAIQWIGEARLKQHRAALEAHLQRPGLSPELFSATLTALALVDGAKFDEAAQGGRIYLERIVEDPKSPAALKARALRRLPGDSKVLTIERIRGWLTYGEGKETGLGLEAVRALRESPLPRKFEELARIAMHDKIAPGLRLEAIVGLAEDNHRATRELLLQLAHLPDNALRHEALRALRDAPLTDGDRATLRDIAKRHDTSVTLIRGILEPGKTAGLPAPEDTDAWLKQLDGPADATAGQRIFFHSKVGACYRCHRFDGRGSDVGPDLSLTARTLDRRKLVESILQPSKEIAPLYSVWNVQTEDGRTFTGTLVRETAEGEQTYADANGKLIKARIDEIANRTSQKRSIMPDDVAKTLTVQEFRDLLAFLKGAGGSAAKGNADMR